MVDIAALTKANAQRFAAASPTRNFINVARGLVQAEAKAQYQAVAAATGVPWPVIAVIHERESSQNWTRSLAQGDPWNKASVHVPIGRGPFGSWREAAIDALVNCSPYLAKHHDWSIGGTLTALEAYNGLGYAARNVPSPYLWAGTNQYRSGKFVRDGVYSAGVVDQQLGCAGLLLAMMSLDKSIRLGEPDAAPPPAAPKPSSKSWLAAIADILSSIFKRSS